MILLLLLLIILAAVGVRCHNRLKVLAEAVRSRRSNILAVTRKRADLASRLIDMPTATVRTRSLPSCRSQRI